MSFWDELSSSTGSPTGTAITEDPFARAVRIYQMELENAQATAEARRNPAPNFGVDELTGSPFQLPALDARTPGPATGRRAFGDTEADIRREVIAPFEQFGDALMEPFQRSGRRGTERATTTRREPAPRTPAVRGSATSGYFTVDPVSGKVTEVRPPSAKEARVGQLDVIKYRAAQDILSDPLSKQPEKDDAARIVAEIEARYSAAEEPATAAADTLMPGRNQVQFFQGPQEEMAATFGSPAGSAMPVQQQQPQSFPGMMPGYGGDLSGFLPQGNAAPRPAPSIRILNVRRKQ